LAPRRRGLSGGHEAMRAEEEAMERLARVGRTTAAPRRWVSGTAPLNRHTSDDHQVHRVQQHPSTPTNTTPRLLLLGKPSREPAGSPATRSETRERTARRRPLLSDYRSGS